MIVYFMLKYLNTVKFKGLFDQKIVMFLRADSEPLLSRESVGQRPAGKCDSCALGLSQTVLPCLTKKTNRTVTMKKSCCPPTGGSTPLKQGVYLAGRLSCEVPK